MEIADSAADVCRLLWIVDESDLGATTKVLRKLGKVINAERRTPEELIQLVCAEHPDGITCYFDYDLHRQAWLAAALGLPSSSVRTVARLNDKLLSARPSVLPACRCRDLLKSLKKPTGMRSSGCAGP